MSGGASRAGWMCWSVSRSRKALLALCTRRHPLLLPRIVTYVRCDCPVRACFHVCGRAWHQLDGTNAASSPEATPSKPLAPDSPRASPAPTNHVEEDLLTVFARTTLAPFLLKLPVRIFILVGFCLMFALFTWNSTENTVVGLPPQDLTLKGSYQVREGCHGWDGVATGLVGVPE
jgi:hypothetical protein